MYVIITASSGLSDDQKQMQEVAQEFAKNEFLPNMAYWDENVSTFLSFSFSIFGTGSVNGLITCCRKYFP